MQHSNSRVFAVVGIVVAAIHYGVLASSIVAVVVAVITCVMLALVLFGSPALCVLILGLLALLVVPADLRTFRAIEKPNFSSVKAMLGLPDTVRACLFDLDGVLTDTASVHRKAWKAMFDAYLRDRAQRTGEPFVPFDIAGDYLTYIDGKKREDGVRSFLTARDITLPEGDPDDDPSTETVHGLGNRKNELFHHTIREEGVKVFEGSRRYLEAVTGAGLAVAVVSSSSNTREVLEVTGLDKVVQQRVDGVTMRQEHIAGKPAPDSFLRAAELLSVKPAQAAVFEDALAGVEAGRGGHFGFVVGVDRVGQAEALHREGADIVVTDLAELLPQR